LPRVGDEHQVLLQRTFLLNILNSFTDILNCSTGDRDGRAVSGSFAAPEGGTAMEEGKVRRDGAESGAAGYFVRLPDRPQRGGAMSWRHPRKWPRPIESEEFDNLIFEGRASTLWWKTIY
jgi:hypothetical protein